MADVFIQGRQRVLSKRAVRVCIRGGKTAGGRLTCSPSNWGEGFLAVGKSSLLECHRSGVSRVLESYPDN